METYVGTLHDKLLKDADCRFCTACAAVCPTGTIRDKFREDQADWVKEDKIVPCRHACPAHTDVPRYIRYVKQGKYDEAAAVIREKVPFPEVLGHICTRVCELSCKREALNEPISIRNLKRDAAGRDTGSCWKGKGKQRPDTGKKVCVVGGGPAGLTAAYYLRKQGHSVTVREALPTVGGMMSYGIPACRLPREIVAAEARMIADTGVNIVCGVRVEKPLELLQAYDAVLLAVGSHAGVRLPMEGNNLPGVLLNVDFLRNCAMGQETGLGKQVVVLGGGNVAFDCARSAKRLGAAEVHVACLEARDVMPADDEEIEQAIEEGIHVHPAQTFERITGVDRVTGVDFMNVASLTFHENRQPVIEKVPDSEHHIAADTVIFAVGQRPQLSAEMGVPLGRGNCVVVKDQSTATEIRGLFAAGDAAYGTKSVIMAIASGRDAAGEIDQFLGGDGDISEILAPVEKADAYIGPCPGFGYQERKEPQVDSADVRQGNFQLFDHGLCGDDACAEAGRCLQCDLRLNISRPSLWGDFKGTEGSKG